ncbi:1 [Durusdinium trenchii]|uniref:1 n=1 Tax=Durusdinium trenchii TaxID=1381693 RepID=A0ABP0IIP0_9DINO
MVHSLCEARQRPAAPGLPLRRKLRAWLSRRGRRHSESLVWATLHLWAQSAKAKRLLSARRKAAELKQSQHAFCETMQVSTTLQIRCLLAWRALVQVNSQQDKQSFLAADLESKERCLRVLEALFGGI